MRDTLRTQLDQEISRKQFLQYTAGALLTVFGLNNFISLLSGKSDDRVSLFPSGTEIRRVGYGSKTFGDKTEASV